MSWRGFWGALLPQSAEAQARARRDAEIESNNAACAAATDLLLKTMWAPASPPAGDCLLSAPARRGTLSVATEFTGYWQPDVTDLITVALTNRDPMLAMG